MIVDSVYVENAYDLQYLNPYSSPLGLFWANRGTTSQQTENDNTTTFCETPIVSREQGEIWRMPEESPNFPEDEFFVGCYFTAGFTNALHNQDVNTGLAFMSMFPYTHFMSVWGNFLGYTQMPDRSFSSEHSSMTPEELAIASLPIPPNPENGRDSVLFEQGVTLNHKRDYPTSSQLSNCPEQNSRDYFCPWMGTICTSVTEVSPTTSPSVSDLYGFLILLAIVCTVMAAYWVQVFPGNVSFVPRMSLGECHFFPRVSFFEYFLWLCAERSRTQALLLLAS